MNQVKNSASYTQKNWNFWKTNKSHWCQVYQTINN